MTRLAALADIHGNGPALEAVIADMAQFAVDHVVVAGDVIHRGPFNVQVVEHVVREGWAAIRGNNEYMLLDYRTPRAPAEWNAEPLLAWLADQLRGRLQAHIAAWPDAISLRYPDGPPIRVVHGSPQDLARGYISNAWPDDTTLMPILADVDEPVLICGHTHAMADRRIGRWHVLNPGSVGMPFDGDLRAGYMLLESNGDDWDGTVRRVEYDHERLFCEFARQGFIERGGYVARLIVEEFRMARAFYGPFHRWRAAHYPDEPPTVALVEKFLDSGWWRSDVFDPGVYVNG